MHRTTISLQRLSTHPTMKESLRGLQLVPVEALLKIANPLVTNITDLGDGKGFNS